MTVERSHGKARPTLPRASDLAPVPSAPDPTAGRGPGGRFAPGNRVSVGQGWKAATKRVLGRSATEPESIAVARDAWSLFCAQLRELPNQGAAVRQLVALAARHAAVASFYSDRGGAAGLSDPTGIAFLELASRHGQRAERLLVTALDVSTKLAHLEANKPVDAKTMASLISDASRPVT